MKGATTLRRIGRALRRVARAAWRPVGTLERGVAAPARRLAARRRHAATRRGLERAAHRVRRDGRPRALVLGAWTFPLYSQGFVYREAAGLAAGGFELRFAYSAAGRPEELAPGLARLAASAVPLAGAGAVGAAELERYRRRDRARVDALLERIAAASGLAVDARVARPDVRRAFAFARLAEAYRADYLHSWFFYEGALAVFVAAELLGIPRGLTAYADHRLADHPLKLVALQLERAGLVVATSRRIAAELLALAPGAEPRLLVKPNTVDTARFALPPRPPSPVGTPLHLATVSRIDPKKGLGDLVEAVAELARRGVDVLVEHLGDAEPASEANLAEARGLEARIAALGLGARWSWLGRGSEAEVLGLLARSDLFVVPSVTTAAGDQDGIPTALLEAMATGLPAVATSAGSIPEALADGVEGRIVAPRDPRALAAAIAGLAADPGRRAALGAAAAARARREFDVAREGELARRALGLVRR